MSSSVPSLASVGLAGKWALVTGGCSGIGEAITLALLKAGVEHVITLSSNPQQYDSFLERNCSDGAVGEVVRSCTSFEQADLACVSECKSAAEEAKKRAKEAGNYIGVLVNNAGVAICESLLDTTTESWDTVMAVNVRAPMLLAQSLAEVMIEKGGGKIINVSSVASKVGLADHAAYCASKGALDALTRVMTVELARHNIQCNTVNPTVVMTDMGRRVWSPPEKGGPVLERMPAGRFAEPYEVANMVAMLASDCCSMLNGQSIFIEGGITSTTFVPPAQQGAATR